MIPIVIRKFIKIYLLALSIFSLFRLILFINEMDRIDASTASVDIFYAFVMGIRFDLVVAGYLLILPYFMITIASFLTVNHQRLLRFFFYFLFCLFSFSFFIAAADIPYFGHFFSRMSVTALEWLDTPGIIFGMIMSEPRYWLFSLPFILVVVLFYRMLKRILLADMSIQQPFDVYTITCSLLFLGLIFLGIRGRLALKSPIRVGTAYFSNNAFLNQLGLNPNFTFLRSYLNSLKEKNKPIRLMDNQLAISNVQKYFDIKTINKNYPLLREIRYDSPPVKTPYNFVIIIMESMSTAKMKRHGNPDNLSPFLDSLSTQGYYFENAYTAGIHTFNGIYGTLMAMPSLFRKHPMKGTNLLHYHSIYKTLKEKGYSTAFFTTADGQFDNTEGFLYSNDCETVIAQASYPANEVKTSLGVPDDYMFRFSIPILNQLYKKKKPFVTALMTGSDHAPHYIPDYFKPKNKDIKKQIVEYADYSLRTFMQLASQQTWFDNTIFVFVADHGAAMDGTYDLSLDYNHTPLLFYAPKIIKKPQVFKEMAGQIDIFPSLMGFLKQSYANNTLGIDLFNEKRPYIYFNADDKYAVLDQEWLLIVREDQSKGLYKYRNKDKTDYASELPQKVEAMQVYGASNMQACQYVIANGMQ